MPVKVHCPGCEVGLQIPDASAGKTVRCPRCASEIAVPLPAADLQTPGSDRDDLADPDPDPESDPVSTRAPRRKPGPFPTGAPNFSAKEAMALASIQREKERSNTSRWGWRYNPLFGIMYGPIPVGGILLAVGWLVFYLYNNK